MLIYQVIGWMVVTLFGLTAIVTLLSLIGKLQIDPGYQKKLFNSLILEIVAAGFFLFYEAYSQSHEIETVPAEFYAFSLQGEPISLRLSTAGAGDTLKLIPRPPADAFRDRKRVARIENGNLIITTADSAVALGYVENARDSLSFLLMPAKTALYLGMYLSEYEDGERRKPYEAVKYLFHVLNLPDATDETKSLAVNKLQLLLSYITRSQDFDMLVEHIKKYRTQDYLRYYEVAQTYLRYGKLSIELQPKQHRRALEYYLRYLTTAESRGRLQKQQKDLAKARSLELVRSLRAQDAQIRENARRLEHAIKNHDAEALGTMLPMLFSENLTERNSI